MPHLQASNSAVPAPATAPQRLTQSRNVFRLAAASLCCSVMLLASATALKAETPKGYQQTNLISNGSVDAKVIDKNFVDPWGISIGQDFWINTNVTGLDYVAGPTGVISFTVSIPPASGSGLGSPTGTVFTGSTPAGSFELPDKTTPFFLFCTLDGTVSGWSGGNVQIALNHSKLNAVYNDMALLTNTKGTFLLLANFGEGAAVEVYDTHYKKAMAGAFTDPDVPKTYAPYAVHVLNNTVYVTYTPRTVPGYSEILGPGHGFVDAFDETGKFLSRVIPVGDKLNAPWGMALAPATFGSFGGDLLVGNFGDGTISAYDAKTYKFQGQVSDANGNLIANPGLWEIVFGQANPAVGDPNTLYFTAGLNNETAGLFGTITVASAATTKTKTTITSDGNPQTKGTKVTFTALVQPATGTGEPEGKVAFTVDGVALGTAKVDSTAHASIGDSTLTVGKHVVKATYSGDANFLTSSAMLTETINVPATAAPAFSPAAGSYTGPKTVSITDATKGAVIYYTLNGTTPTIKSTVYSKPFVVAKTTTVKALAVASGLANSSVSSATYTINATPTAATPTFSLKPGTFSTTQTVSLLDATKGAEIWYTLDGSTPTFSSPVYSKPLSISKTTTIKAFASASGFANSPVSSATYTITVASPTAAPTFSPAPGTFTTEPYISLSSATTGAKIYYTTDGSTPTTSSTLYSSTIWVTSTMTIKAIAIAPGWTVSPVTSGTFTINSGGGW